MGEGRVERGLCGSRGPRGLPPSGPTRARGGGGGAGAERESDVGEEEERDLS